MPEADQTQRHEELEILLSFYGPNSGAYMSAFRDGIQLAQNREQLMLAVFAHIDTGDEVEVPTLIKDRYTRRKDIPWRVRRQVLRTYPVLDLLSAVGSIVTDVPALSIPLAVNPPN